MDFKKCFLKPALLFVGFTLAIVLFLIIYVSHETSGHIVSFFSVFFILAYLIVFSYIFQQDTSGSLMSRFLRIKHREPLNYNRLMGAIGEILISSTVLAIAVAFSAYFDSAGYTRSKVFLAIFTVLFVLLAITFSITTILVHCFSHNKQGKINFVGYALVGGLLMIFSALTVNFGIASGKGISSYYIQMYSDNN